MIGLRAPAMTLGFLTSLLVAMVWPVRATADIVRLRADYWCPYNCDPADASPGYIVEIAELAAKRLGLTIDYGLMPWDRTMSEVRLGTVDAAIGATVQEAEGTLLSDPLGYDADCFFVVAGKPWRFRDVESLDEILLGAVSGYTHDEGAIDAYIETNSGPNGSVITSSGDDASTRNVRLLLLGRVDAIIDSEAVVRMEAARKGRAADIQPAGCLDPLALHIAFSPKFEHGPAMVQALRAEVEALRNSGKLKEILGRYGLSDWQP
jgi:polar amino acid transport system substrate-binding protein